MSKDSIEGEDTQEEGAEVVGELGDREPGSDWESGGG